MESKLNSLNDHLTYLYNTISIQELIFYYFIIYLIVRVIQRILNINIKDKFPLLNSKVIFSMILFSYLSYILELVNNWGFGFKLLENLIISGFFFIIIILIIYHLVVFLFEKLMCLYDIIFIKKLNLENYNIKKDAQINQEEINRRNKNIFSVFRNNIFYLFIDVSIFVLLSKFLNNLFVLIPLIIISLINLRYDLIDFFTHIKDVKNTHQINFTQMFKSKKEKFS